MILWDLRLADPSFVRFFRNREELPDLFQKKEEKTSRNGQKHIK